MWKIIYTEKQSDKRICLFTLEINHTLCELVANHLHRKAILQDIYQFTLEIKHIMLTCPCNRDSFTPQFLAHLSQRLIGELIVYPWSVGVRRRPSSTMLKHLLLRNRLADQSQILCGASLARGNEILFAASGSHDQDGRQAPYMVKTLQKSSSPEPAGRFSRNLVCSIRDSSPS